MGNRIKEIIVESRIVNVCANLNRTILLYFYRSKTHELFIDANNFFRKTIPGNAGKSLIVNVTKKLFSRVTARDAGAFVILVTLFNTLAMFAFGKEIDIFSISARVFFLLLAVCLIVKR